MRLTLGGKLAIFLVLGIATFFLIKKFVLPKGDELVDKTENPRVQPTTPQENKKPEQSEDKSSSASPTAHHEQTFAYMPEKPVNGTLKGVVEVGATGFNSFIIDMDRERRWQIMTKDFGESLAYEGLATTDDIRAGLKKYLAKMFDKGVSSRNMHFVISSGAQKEPKTLTISNELKKMGYIVNLVTAEQEGKFALKATIPESYQDNSFLLDIGSGTSKVSWEEDNRLKAFEAAGAKYYEKDRSDDEVYAETKAKADKIPANKRNVCFIIGGVPFTLAKQHRSGEERYTVLRTPQSYKAVDKKMASGLNIYKAVADATKCDTFVFDWDANFTIGFLLSLPVRD